MAAGSEPTLKGTHPDSDAEVINFSRAEEVHVLWMEEPVMTHTRRTKNDACPRQLPQFY